MFDSIRWVLVVIGLVTVGCAAPSASDEGSSEEATGETEGAAVGRVICLKTTSDHTEVSGTTTTRTIYIKNQCGKTKRISLDLALAVDPPCQTVNNGKEAKFEVVYDDSWKIAVRGAKLCD